MRDRWKGIRRNRNCVSWQRLAAESEPITTLGSAMNRLAAVTTTHRAIFLIAFFLVPVLFSVACAPLHAQSAKTYYKRGQAAEAPEDFDAAFNDYQKAYSMEPKDLSYKNAYYRAMVPNVAIHMKNGRRLMQTGDEQGALTEFLRVTLIDPSNEAAAQEIAKIRALHKEQLPQNVTGVPQPSGPQTELESMAGPVQLKP